MDIALILPAASALVGVTGVISIVPKRAGEDLIRLTASYGSVARFGGYWDVARRWINAGAFRLHAAHCGALTVEADEATIVPLLASARREGSRDQHPHNPP